MGADLTRAAILVAFPVLAAIIGSAIAAYRPPGPKVTSGVQHFAAGVVFAAAAGEVLPDLKGTGHLPAVVIGFVIGAAVMLALQEMERRAEHRTETTRDAGAARRALPIGMLTAIGVDFAIDGVLVGLGATLSLRQGVILTVALTLEIGFLAIAVTAKLTDSAGSKIRAATISSALALAVVTGAFIAVIALTHAPAWLVIAVLAAGIAALLFLITEELITEAHEAATDTPILTSLFFAGFIILFALEGIG